MFTEEDGNAYHLEVITHFFTQAVKEAKLPEIRLHDLRHTHATTSVAALRQGSRASREDVDNVASRG